MSILFLHGLWLMLQILGVIVGSCLQAALSVARGILVYWVLQDCCDWATK
jgi:hypothetical protein